MKKQTIIIIATLAVVAVLAVILILVQGNSSPIADDINKNPYSGYSLEVAAVNQKDIASISARNFPGSPDFDVDLTYDVATMSSTYTVRDNPYDYYYSETYLRLMATTVSALTASSVAADGADPAGYGIGEDSISYVVHLNDGSEYTLTLGALTPLGNGYYIQKSDSGIIYIISEYDGSTLERDLYEMRTVVLYPTIESYLDLFRLKVEYPDGSIIESVQLSSDEIATGSTYALFKFIKPLEIFINDDVAGPNYYELAVSLGVTDILEDDADVNDLSKYGLDKPIALTFVNKDGETTSFCIGDYLEDGISRYAMLPDASCIFVLKGTFDFLTVDIYTLLDSTIWIHSITDISDISIKSGKAEYKMYVDDYVDTEDSSNSHFYAEMDGTAIEEKNFRRFYQELVALPSVGVLRDLDYDVEQIKKLTPDYSFDFVYKDKSEHFVHLYKINDIYYAAEVDDNTLFYTSVSQIDKIMRYAEKLSNGEEIPEV